MESERKCLFPASAALPLCRESGAQLLAVHQAMERATGGVLFERQVLRDILALANNTVRTPHTWNPRFASVATGPGQVEVSLRPTVLHARLAADGRCHGCGCGEEGWCDVYPAALIRADEQTVRRRLMWCSSCQHFRCGPCGGACESCGLLRAENSCCRVCLPPVSEFSVVHCCQCHRTVCTNCSWALHPQRLVPVCRACATPDLPSRPKRQRLDEESLEHAW